MMGKQNGPPIPKGIFNLFFEPFSEVKIKPIYIPQKYTNE
jgi:hypothetical protein